MASVTLELSARLSRPLRLSRKPDLHTLPHLLPCTRQFSIACPRVSPPSTLATKQHLTPSLRAIHTSQVLQSETGAKFGYGVAASFSAKDQRFSPEKSIFNFNPYNHIRARRKDKRTRPGSGQDAFFVSRVGESSDVALGVADGVGGWVNSGVDPADFSHGFCDYMAHAAYTHRPEAASSALTARGLMQRGYDDICGDETVRAGGSTACVALAREDGHLEVANLGDSGFVLLRLNAIHRQSYPQTHAFNTPYQLSIIPEKALAQAAVFGGTQLHDMPKDANVSQHALRHGDVVALATDGVWDNLSSQDILTVVSQCMLDLGAWQHTRDGISVGEGLQGLISDSEQSSAPHDSPQPTLQAHLAMSLAGKAKAASTNTKVDGPFAREVQKYYPYENWRGGKEDDICVIVAVVVEEGK